MSGLTKYILKQAAGPMIMFTLILTALVWLTQSLQMLDLVINRQQSSGTYFLMTLYVLPSLLTVILPFALFCASIFILHRLSSDSELIVMWSAGVSPMAIAKPMFILGCFVAVVNLLLNLYVMPAGYREMKDKVYEIRTDIASNMIRDGQFTNPMPGLTVYNRITTPNGELHSLLIHDNRDKAQPKTYIAELGKFVRSPEGPRLVMLDGNIQQVNERGEVSFVYFDQYSLDISQFMGPRPLVMRDLTERYLHELLIPDMSVRWHRQNEDRLRAEGHNRLASPLYNLVFIMIALCATMLGGFSRRGNSHRLVIALVFGLLARLSGFGIQSLAAKMPALVVYQYLIPLFLIFACAYLLFDLKPYMGKFLDETRNKFSPLLGRAG